MIRPIPKLAEPVVTFLAASEFYGDHLSITEEEDLAAPWDSSEPFILIGYDGKAWRVQETWGPPLPLTGLFEKFVAWVINAKPSPSLIGREVTPVHFSLEEFKSEVCRRIPGNPGAVLGDEVAAGEGAPRGADIERLVSHLIEKVCAKVQAATSIAGVMDVLLEAQRDGGRWAEEFFRRPPVSP